MEASNALPSQYDSENKYFKNKLALLLFEVSIDTYQEKKTAYHQNKIISFASADDAKNFADSYRDIFDITPTAIGECQFVLNKEHLRLYIRAREIGLKRYSIEQFYTLVGAINNINAYFTRRAQETSGTWVSIRGTFSGEDYYERRTSWRKILGELARVNSRSNIIDIKQAIQKEAEKYKRSALDCWSVQRNDFYDNITNLLTCIESSDDILLLNHKLEKDIAIYTAMSKCKNAVLTESKSFSLFSQNKKQLGTEFQDYEKVYNSLSPNEKTHFLNRQQEEEAEKNNIDRYYGLIF